MAHICGPPPRKCVLVTLLCYRARIRVKQGRHTPQVQNVRGAKKESITKINTIIMHDWKIKINTKIHHITIINGDRIWLCLHNPASLIFLIPVLSCWVLPQLCPTWCETARRQVGELANDVSMVLLWILMFFLHLSATIYLSESWSSCSPHSVQVLLLYLVEVTG